MTAGEKTSRGAIVYLVLAAVVGAATALMVAGFLTEYGTTTGSPFEGATDAVAMGLLPLLVGCALAGAALVAGRRTPWLRRASVLVALVSVAALLAGGAQAAVTKYDRFPTSPTCDPRGFAVPIKAMLERVQEAGAELGHPDRFSGGGSTGYDGCTDHLLNVTFDEAADHYRGELPARGWVITSHAASPLRARRGDLAFVLSGRRHGEIAVHIGPTPAAARQLAESLGHGS